MGTHKMNEIVNKFLLVRDKFMPEIHLKQPAFTYSAFVPFTKKQRKNWKGYADRKYKFVHKNELDKAYFQHDMTYGKRKDLVRRNQSDKVLKDKAFKIANDPKYDGYQRGLASMVYKFKKSALLNKSKGSGIVNEPNYQLENELPKPIIKKFKKEKRQYLGCWFSRYAIIEQI